MIVRQAIPSDLEQCYKCILPYASESWQGKQCPVDLDVVRSSLESVLQAENFMRCVVEVDGKIAGLAFGYSGNTWWREPCGAFDFFYVSQNYRGLGVARKLVKGALDQFRLGGCGFIYAGAESNVSERNTKLYENLFKKFGFRDIGGGRMILNLRGQ